MLGLEPRIVTVPQPREETQRDCQFIRVGALCKLLAESVWRSLGESWELKKEVAALGQLKISSHGLRGGGSAKLPFSDSVAKTSVCPGPCYPGPCFGFNLLYLSVPHCLASAS